MISVGVYSARKIFKIFFLLLKKGVIEFEWTFWPNIRSAVVLHEVKVAGVTYILTFVPIVN